MPFGEARCPQCGGAVRPREEDGFTVCEFCGRSLRLDPDTGVPHELLAPSIKREELAERLGRWLQERETAGRPGSLSARLVFIPFWVIPEGEASRLVAAAPILSGALAGFRLPSGDRKAFREDLTVGGQVLEATVLLESLLHPGREAPRGTRLVHLPFWEATFRLGGSEHKALIDADGGQVIPFSLPPSSERWLDWLHSALLTGLFLVLFRGFRLFLLGGPSRMTGLLLLASAGPLVWGAARLANRWATR